MLDQVFLSYRRESEVHVGRVRSLAEELRRRGLPVVFDEFYLAAKPEGPDEKWSRWCINQAKESACVLIVGSAGWYSAFADPKSAAPEDGFGAAAEANVIEEQLYQMKWVTGCHRVVLLDAADAHGLPVEISGWRQFAPLSNQQDMDDLVRWAAQRTNTSLSGDVSPTGSSWPDKPPSLFWPMADHIGVRDTFGTLLTSTAPWRFLPLRGPSEAGKSTITRQMIANALPLAGVTCGRFDFKGTTDVDAELRSFVQFLQVPMPPGGLRLNDGLARVLDALKQRARPTLLVFDTYEAAGETQDWVDKQLLPNLLTCAWLGVYSAGHGGPGAAGAIWLSAARAPLELVPPPPEDWLIFGQPYKPGLTIDFVRQAYQFCGGRTSVLAQLLGPAT
jgi:hypothetical protein